MDKKGVSAIVAVVFILVLSLVAVTVLWKVLSPTFKSLSADDYRRSVDLSINSLSGYTCLDYSQGIFSVQVKKGPEEFNISSLKFFVLSEGNSVYYQKDYFLSVNSEKVFYLNVSGLQDITQIGFVPVFYTGTKEFEGSKISLSKFDSCTLLQDSFIEVLNPNNRTPLSTESSQLIFPANQQVIFLNSSSINSQIAFEFSASEKIKECNVFIDGLNNFSSSDAEKVGNVYFKNISGFSIGLHSWKVSCSFIYSNLVVNSSEYSFYVSQPSINLTFPLNNSLIGANYYLFNYSINDSFNSCKFYVNNTLVGTDSSPGVNANIFRNVSLALLDQGRYSWYVLCNYSAGQVTSPTYFFNITDFWESINFNYTTSVFQKTGVQTFHPIGGTNLSILNISTTQLPGSSLRLFYNFDYNNTTAVFDLNTYLTKSHGLFMNSPRVSSTGSLSGNSLVLDGVNDYLQIDSGTSNFWENNDALLDAFDQNYSISFWMKSSASFSSPQYIFYASEYHTQGCDPNTGYIAVFFSSTRIYSDYRNYIAGCGSIISVNTAHNANDGNWQNFVVSREVVSGAGISYMRIYKNGVLLNTSTGSQTGDLRMWSHYHLGAGGGGSLNQHQDYFNGSIDNFMVFNKALSSAEVLQIYNNQSRLFNQSGIITYSNMSISNELNSVTLIFNVSQISDSNIEARVGYGNSSTILGYSAWTSLNSTGGVSMSITEGSTVLIPQLRLLSDSYGFYTPVIY